MELDTFSYEDTEESRFPENSSFSYVRLLHASPDAPAVDLYINDKLIVKGLKYKFFTQYIKLQSGLYTVTIYPTNTKAKPVINSKFNLPPRTIYTVAVIGLLKNITLEPILEPIITYNPGASLIRFIHLSPNSPHVDWTLPDGKKLFKDVEYKEVTGYIPIKPANYTFQARLTGTDKVILIVPNEKFLPNRVHSIYLVGLFESSPPLQVLIPLDGGSYLHF